MRELYGTAAPPEGRVNLGAAVADPEQGEQCRHVALGKHKTSNICRGFHPRVAGKV